MEISFIIYSFIFTSGFFVTYVGFLAIEISTGNRVISNIRLYVDQRILKFMKYVGIYADKVDEIYDISEEKIEEEIFQPIATPIVSTHEKFDAIRTGKKDIKKYSLSSVSPYLRKLKKSKE